VATLVDVSLPNTNSYHGPHSQWNGHGVPGIESLRIECGCRRIVFTLRRSPPFKSIFKKSILIKSQIPKYLRPETQKWFASVINEYTSEQHHVQLLTKCAEAYDRSEEAPSLRSDFT